MDSHQSLLVRVLRVMPEKQRMRKGCESGALGSDLVVELFVAFIELLDQSLRCRMLITRWDAHANILAAEQYSFRHL